MPEPDFVIRADDTASIIADTLQDEDGNPVDIGGATVRFHMRPLSGSPTPVLDSSASNDQVDSSTTGFVSYAWTAGNTASAGWYLAEWEVSFTDDNIQSFPNAGYILVAVTSGVA